MAREVGYSLKEIAQFNEISKITTKLIRKALQKGIWEDFGQDEVRKLKDKYGYTPQIKRFDNWLMTVDLEQLKKLKKVI